MAPPQNERMRAVLVACLLLLAALGWCLWPAEAALTRDVGGVDRVQAVQATGDAEPPPLRELAAGGAALAGEVPALPPTPFGLWFAVVDAAGSPTPGVPIQVDWDGQDDHDGVNWRGRGVCDSEGRFGTPLRSVAAVQGVEVTLPYFGRAETVHTLQSSRKRPDTVLLVAPGIADLAARVVDADGHAVAGARVDVEHVATWLEPGRNALQVETRRGISDADGNARLSVPIGRAAVRVVAPAHYADCSWQCEFRPGHNELVLEVDALADWRTVPVTVWIAGELAGWPRYSAEVGRMRSRRPQPNVAAVVPERRWLYPSNVPRDDGSDSLAGGSPPTSKPAREWVYAFRVPPGDWHLRLELPGAETFARGIGADEAAVRVEFRPPEPTAMFSLRGTVHTAAGEPAEGAEIYWHTLSERPSERLVARADAEGRFTHRVPVGDGGWVAAWRGDEAPAFAGPWIGPGRTIDMALRLQAPQQIVAQLVDAAGQDIAGSLRLRNPELAHWPVEMQGCWPGQFVTFQRLPAGTYELWAEPDRGGWPARRLVATGATVTLRCGEGLDDFARVAARIVDAATLQPLPFAECGERTADETGWLGLVLPPGTAEVDCEHPGYATLRVRWPALQVGLHERTIELPREQVRRVRLVDEHGRAMACAEVQAVDPGGPAGAYWPRSSDTDDDGRAELRGLPAGTLNLHVGRRERIDGGLLDTGERREFELPADAGVSATAVLRWSEGRPR